MNGCKRVVAAPRGHAKSTSLTFKGTIHAVVYGYKHYPIIISDSSDQAEGFLDNIRVEFEENEAIREDFGDLTGKVWRSNVLVTSTNIKVEADWLRQEDPRQEAPELETGSADPG